jgi:hypothetical protein
MLTLLILFALKVATPDEIACVGTVQDLAVPLELYIAGVQEEGTASLASHGQIVYLNGPQVPSLKPGMVRRVIRPERKVRDRLARAEAGIYYTDIGTIQIETVEPQVATARVLLSCREMLKGDQVIPNAPNRAVEFGGALSNALTPLPPNGLVSSILLGKNNLQELSAGQFCFVGFGGRDGVKAGDQFIVFRPNPAAVNPEEMIAKEPGIRGLLNGRKLPPQILGDIIVVEAGDRISAAKIINSLSEIHPGDLVVKK